MKKETIKQKNKQLFHYIQLIKNIIIVCLFFSLYVEIILLTMDMNKSRNFISVYGLVLFIYLFLKMSLAIYYRPFKGEAKKYKVAVVIPSYNEDPEPLLATLKSILNQTYPIEKIYIVDDGSPDKSGYNAVYKFIENNKELCKNVILYTLPENKGKRHAQTWAFERSDAEIFCTIDSDTVVYKNAVEELIKAFNDENVYAVTGHINVRNVRENILTKLIDIRYENAFRVERAAQSVTGNILTCSGPLSCYRREVIIPNLYHYTHQYFLGEIVNIGDDRCLTNYAAKLGKTVYQSTARCDTDAPSSLRVFMKQQTRWNKSFIRESINILKMIFQKPTVSFWTLLEVVLSFVLGYSLIIFMMNIKFYSVNYYVGLAVLIFISSYARNVHYILVSPIRYLIVPLYTVLHIFVLVPIRFYALLTIKNVKWGTREKEVVFEESEMA